MTDSSRFNSLIPSNAKRRTLVRAYSVPSHNLSQYWSIGLSSIGPLGRNLSENLFEMENNDSTNECDNVVSKM